MYPKELKAGITQAWMACLIMHTPAPPVKHLHWVIKYPGHNWFLEYEPPGFEYSHIFVNEEAVFGFLCIPFTRSTMGKRGTNPPQVLKNKRNSYQLSYVDVTDWFSLKDDLGCSQYSECYFSHQEWWKVKCQPAVVATVVAMKFALPISSFLSNPWVLGATQLAQLANISNPIDFEWNIGQGEKKRCNWLCEVQRNMPIP